jgi:hypothetical protein
MNFEPIYELTSHFSLYKISIESGSQVKEFSPTWVECINKISISEEYQRDNFYKKKISPKPLILGLDIVFTFN